MQLKKQKPKAEHSIPHTLPLFSRLYTNSPLVPNKLVLCSLAKYAKLPKQPSLIIILKKLLPNFMTGVNQFDITIK